MSSTPTKCSSAKQIESVIPKKIKSKCETSKEEKVKKSNATSKKRQGTKTLPKQNVTKKLASDKRKQTNKKGPPKAKNKLPDVKINLLLVNMDCSQNCNSRCIATQKVEK